MALVYRQVQYEYDHMKLKEPDLKKQDGLTKELAKFDSLKPAPLPVAMTVHDVGPAGAADARFPRKSPVPRSSRAS